MTFLAKLFKYKKVILIMVATVVIIGTTTTVCYNAFAKNDDTVITKSTVKKEAQVIIKNVILGEAQKAGSLYGYQNNNYQYDYTYDESPNILKANEDDGMISSGAKKVGKWFAGKEYFINLTSSVKIGWDFSKAHIEEIQKDRFLVVVQNLEAVMVPNFSESELDSKYGLFRNWHTEKERRDILSDCMKQGTFILAQDKEELEKGFEYTNQAFKDLMYTNPDIAKKDIQFEFKLMSDEIVFDNEQPIFNTNK